MPHINVMLWPGKSPEQKQALSDAIVKNVTELLGNSLQSVSVGFEEVEADDWMVQVYDPIIAARWNDLTQKPGYGPGPDG